MKVHKVTLMVIDHENYGAESVRDQINFDTEGRVIKIETAEIGEWLDENPLNFSTTQEAEMRRLFPDT
jgi:hypothetical protein